MKSNKKGFTLIELLAVIVILAIIALIATPIVLNLIERSRKGAFARGAEGVLKSSKLYYTSSLVEDIEQKKITFTCNNKECISDNGTKLDVDGNMVEGTVSITSEEKILFELGNGVYCAEKEEDNSKITVTKKKCGEIIINAPTNLEITYTSKKVGEVTVVGSVSNKPAEIESYECSIDNGVTWVKGEKEEYELPTSYTVNENLSGGNVTCIDESNKKITNTNVLSIGEHTITCTVTTGA